MTSNNDFPAGTTFNSLIFSGGNYTISGSSLALNTGILATNGIGNRINNILILNSNQTFTLRFGSGSFFLPTAIDTNGKELTFDVTPGTVVQVQAVISGAGGLIKTGPGSVFLYASNTFSGPVQLNQGAIGMYNGRALGTTNSGTTIADGATLAINNPISVPEALTLAGKINSTGPGQTLTGPFALTGTNAIIQGSLDGSLSVNSVISGEVGFTKAVAGNLILNSNNTYAGLTTVAGGDVFVNGRQPRTPILLTGGALAGTGTVGIVTATGTLPTFLSPGSSPGILTCSNLALTASNSLVLDLNGTAAGAGYDQLRVQGSVALGNAMLSVTLTYTPGIGDTYIVLDNDGEDPIVGTFAGLTNQSILTLNGYPFQITYHGGTGNDIQLTRISPPTQLASITPLPNGQIQLAGTGGLPGFTNIIQAATNLNPVIQWINIGGVAADSGGAFSFTDTNAPLLPMRFYRIQSP